MHVSFLKRIPERKAVKAPKPPKLSGKLQAKARVYELSLRKTMYPVPYALVKEGRKSFKIIQRASVECAAQTLGISFDVALAYLEKKKFLLEGEVASA